MAQSRDLGERAFEHQQYRHGLFTHYVEPVPQKAQCHNAPVGDEPITFRHRTKRSDFV
jgi:hypothetical protein